MDGSCSETILQLPEGLLRRLGPHEGSILGGEGTEGGCHRTVIPEIGEPQEALQLLKQARDRPVLDCLDHDGVSQDVTCSDSQPQEQHLGDFTLVLQQSSEDTLHMLHMFLCGRKNTIQIYRNKQTKYITCGHLVF